MEQKTLFLSKEKWSVTVPEEEKFRTKIVLQKEIESGLKA